MLDQFLFSVGKDVDRRINLQMGFGPSINASDKVFCLVLNHSESGPLDHTLEWSTAIELRKEVGHHHWIWESLISAVRSHASHPSTVRWHKTTQTHSVHCDKHRRLLFWCTADGPDIAQSMDHPVSRALFCGPLMDRAAGPPCIEGHFLWIFGWVLLDFGFDFCVGFPSFYFFPEIQNTPILEYIL